MRTARPRRPRDRRGVRHFLAVGAGQFEGFLVVPLAFLIFLVVELIDLVSRRNRSVVYDPFTGGLCGGQGGRGRCRCRCLAFGRLTGAGGKGPPRPRGPQRRQCADGSRAQATQRATQQATQCRERTDQRAPDHAQQGQPAPGQRTGRHDEPRGQDDAPAASPKNLWKTPARWKPAAPPQLAAPGVPSGHPGCPSRWRSPATAAGRATARRADVPRGWPARRCRRRPQEQRHGPAPQGTEAESARHVEQGAHGSAGVAVGKDLVRGAAVDETRPRSRVAGEREAAVDATGDQDHTREPRRTVPGCVPAASLLPTSPGHAVPPGDGSVPLPGSGSSPSPAGRPDSPAPRCGTGCSWESPRIHTRSARRIRAIASSRFLPWVMIFASSES